MKAARDEVEKLYDRLNADPQDWAARMRLEEVFTAAGDERLAAGQRWQVLFRKTAIWTSPFSWTVVRHESNCYTLSDELFRRLTGGELYENNPEWRDYKTVQEADEDLAKALFPEG